MLVCEGRNLTSQWNQLASTGKPKPQAPHCIGALLRRLSWPFTKDRERIFCTPFHFVSFAKDTTTQCCSRLSFQFGKENEGRHSNPQVETQTKPIAFLMGAPQIPKLTCLRHSRCCGRLWRCLHLRRRLNHCVGSPRMVADFREPPPSLHLKPPPTKTCEV